jgi:hypothetical protein
LIWINDDGLQVSTMNSPTGRIPMPVETIVVLAAVISAFGLFGIAVAWAERRTRRLSPQK